MDNAGYILLSRLTAQQRAVAVTAHNLANADTPGFQASRPIFAAYLSDVSRRDAPAGGNRIGFTWDRATWRDTDAGPVSRTGNPLDVAIAGEGYFAVETERGERYTRAGRFSIGPDGTLQDLGGHPVLNRQGQRIAVAPDETRLEIRGDGTLIGANGEIAQLRLVRFASPQTLRLEGERLFDPNGEAPLPLDRPNLVSGAVEGANVQPVMEITRLTTEMREFQFATQFADREGERVQTAIDRILRRR
jgi:flagellar basal-body rod protein FlgF